MQHLGQTRSSYQPDHLLVTPDTFVRAPLPGMEKAVAVVHVSPARGARFTQYTVEFEAGGRMAPGVEQRFLYVLEGHIEVAETLMAAGAYAFLPSNEPVVVRASVAARVSVIEKPYQPLQGHSAPEMFIRTEVDVEPKPLGGDPDLIVKSLIPDDVAFDFAVNTMTYEPGAALSMVEMHVMEHGLLMLEGGGIYRLGDRWYPVTAGDFIYMAPWCPQWFGALGKTPAKYLIYKDWNR